MAERPRGKAERGRALAAVIALAGVLLAVATFLRWRDALGPVHVFSTAGGTGRTAIATASSKSEWDAAALPGVLLSLLALSAVALAVRLWAARAGRGRLAWGMTLASIAGAVYCGLLLGQDQRSALIHYVRAYGSPHPSALVAVSHGLGVVLALVANVVLAIGCAIVGHSSPSTSSTEFPAGSRK